MSNATTTLAEDVQVLRKKAAGMGHMENGRRLARVLDALTVKTERLEFMRREVEAAKELLQQRDALLAALKRAGEALHKLSTHDCGCEPAHCTCLTGRSAEIELEARMDIADEEAREVSAVLGRINGGAAA